MNERISPASMKNVQIATTDKDILATYHVMKQLRPNIRSVDYLKLVKIQRAEVGFQLAAL